MIFSNILFCSFLTWAFQFLLNSSHHGITLPPANAKTYENTDYDKITFNLN
jgi:hypothetical protein